MRMTVQAAAPQESWRGHNDPGLSLVSTKRWATARETLLRFWLRAVTAARCGCKTQSTAEQLERQPE